MKRNALDVPGRLCARRNPLRAPWMFRGAVALGLLLSPAFMPLATAQVVEARTSALAADAVARFEIPAGSLADAIDRFGEQSGLRVLYSPDLAENVTVPAVSGELSPAQVLQIMLRGTGIVGVSVNDETLVLRRAADIGAEADAGIVTMETAQAENTVPAPASATDIDSARRAGVEEIIVTGQKKAERLQDVPIAISAFDMQQLDAKKIEGGFDLLKAIPNVTFSKSNFTGYNFQVRGIGTQAVSATTDPGVAVSLNNTTLIVNRL